MHWIYLIHEFHNLSWITEINELFHNIRIYWDAPVYINQLEVKCKCKNHKCQIWSLWKCVYVRTHSQTRVTVHGLHNLHSLKKQTNCFIILHRLCLQCAQQYSKSSETSWWNKKAQNYKVNDNLMITLFSTSQLGSIWASPSGSRITVWNALKSVIVTSALSGHASNKSVTLSLSKSVSHMSPTPLAVGIEGMKQTCSFLDWISETYICKHTYMWQM